MIDAQVADSIAVGEIWPRVTTIEDMCRLWCHRQCKCWYQEPKFLFKMPPRRSKGEEIKYLFFKDELKMGDDAFVLIGKEVAPNSKIHEAMFPLLEEFTDVFHYELPDALPPLCDIQHHIDLEPSSQLSNRQHYRLCLGEHEELRRQKLRDFVEGLPYHGDSSIDDLVGNSRMNFVYLWGNDAGPSVEERALLFLVAQDRIKDWKQSKNGNFQLGNEKAPRGILMMSKKVQYEVRRRFNMRSEESLVNDGRRWQTIVDHLRPPPDHRSTVVDRPSQVGRPGQVGSWAESVGSWAGSRTGHVGFGSGRPRGMPRVSHMCTRVSSVCLRGIYVDAE
nr:putative reverse transcriptase domain-containing protein [Tanacetum cinerariifolium]